MQETIREKILQQIKSNLQKITTANGYNSKIGSYVIRGQAVGPISSLPATIIQALPDEQPERKYDIDSLLMPVIITGNALYDINSDYETEKDGIASLAEAILGDIRYAMGQAIAGEFISYCDDIMYAGGGIEDFPDLKEGELAIQAIARYDIKYATLRNDPYNQEIETLETI